MLRDHFRDRSGGAARRSAALLCFRIDDHARQQSLAPALQMTASVTPDIRSGFADASARWPIVRLLLACRRGARGMRSSPEEDRSGVLRLVVDLQAAINQFLEEDQSAFRALRVDRRPQ